MEKNDKSGRGGLKLIVLMVVGVNMSNVKVVHMERGMADVSIP